MDAPIENLFLNLHNSHLNVQLCHLSKQNRCCWKKPDNFLQSPVLKIQQ